MKNYDYKDETKDVKGKVSLRQKYKIPTYEELKFQFSHPIRDNTLTLILLFVDWETQCNLRASVDASGLEKCS